MSGVSLTLAAVTGGLAVLHIVIHDADSLAEYLNVRYADQAEIDAVEANWQASLY